MVYFYIITSVLLILYLTLRIKNIYKKRMSNNKFNGTKGQSHSYLAILFGDYRNKEQKISNIIYSITPLANSKDVRFVYSDSHILIHFTSNFIYSELQKLIDMAIHSECDLYLFFSYNESFSVKMPPEVFNHLFDWSKESKSVNLDLRNNKLINIGFGPSQEEISKLLSDLEFEEFDDLPEILFGNLKTEKVETPLDMDSILEKIKTSGIESLTKQEQEFLKNISNNNEEN